MDFDAVMEIVNMAPELIKIAIETGKHLKLDKAHGFIHKSEKVVIDGVHGWLVWDYILYNEITFDEDGDDGRCISLFHSFSDQETEQVFDGYVKKYGV